jgi:beta-glucosidase
MQNILSFLTILALFSCQPDTSIDQKVDDIIKQMTTAEKVGQMTQIDHRFLDDHEDITDYAIGSLLSGGGSHPKENTHKAWVDLYNGYQEKALASRLGIPLIYGIDAVHGHNNVKGATIYPHNIGLGATGNPEIVRSVSHATSSEVAATGINWTFAPCIATPQDYRWGRTYEGFSSDPKLVLDLGVAAVEGYQSSTKKNPRKVIACAKHFIGDGNTIYGTGINNLVDRGNTVLTKESLKKNFNSCIPSCY